MKKKTTVDEYVKIVKLVYYPLLHYLVAITNQMLKSGLKNSVDYTKKEIHTKVDGEIEHALITFIDKTWPNQFGFITEESALKDIKHRFCVFIDPIDGTRNYVAGNPLYGISVGIWDIEVSEPIIGIVYSPLLNELYGWHYKKESTLNGEIISVSKTKDIKKSIFGASFLRDKKEFHNNWERMASYYSKISQEVYGFRILQCDSLTLCWVASGKLDGAILPASRSFDFAGGLAIILGSGGKFFELTNGPDISFANKYIDLFVSNKYLFDTVKDILK